MGGEPPSQWTYCLDCLYVEGDAGGHIGHSAGPSRVGVGNSVDISRNL